MRDLPERVQIANGILQLWRFFSHVRRGPLKETVDADTAAMVLTLDSFMTMNRTLKAKIIAEANSLADKEEDISAEDRRHIIFCPIHGIEEVVCTSTEESFLASLKAAGEENMPGGSFARLTARRRRRREAIEPKQFPFELDDLLPWWKSTNDIKGRERSSLTRQALCTA